MNIQVLIFFSIIVYCASQFSETRIGCFVDLKYEGRCSRNYEISCRVGCPAEADPPFCDMTCNTKCNCPDGYVYDSTKDLCIQYTESDCTSGAICPKNQTFNACGTSCPLSCQNSGTSVPCDGNCNRGCFCSTGYIFDEFTRRCIKPEDCPVTGVCEGNRTMNDCGSSCPLSCQNRDMNIPCDGNCHRGCFCSAGYILDEITDRCIKPEDCPVVAFETTTQIGKILCNYGHLYQPGSCQWEFQTSCCEARSTGQCAPVCSTTCRCFKNKLFDVKTNSCIDPSKCHDNCAKNMTFSYCALECPTTCRNKDGMFVCEPDCKIMCMCAEGYVLEETSNRCILKEDCPPNSLDQQVEENVD